MKLAALFKVKRDKNNEARFRSRNNATEGRVKKMIGITPIDDFLCGACFTRNGITANGSATCSAFGRCNAQHHFTHLTRGRRRDGMSNNLRRIVAHDGAIRGNNFINNVRAHARAIICNGLVSRSKLKRRNTNALSNWRARPFNFIPTFPIWKNAHFFTRKFNTCRRAKTKRAHISPQALGSKIIAELANDNVG